MAEISYNSMFKVLNIEYNVVFRGEIASGQSLEDVKEKFAALYKFEKCSGVV